MIKDAYKKELCLKGICSIEDNNSEDVFKVQEWLNLLRFNSSSWHISLEVDGDFGPMTERAVKAYLRLLDNNSKPVEDYSGIVDDMYFETLCWPLLKAFATDIENRSSGGSTVRESIVEAAYAHLSANPRELFNKNMGPWVRSYMDGKDGVDQLWCVGVYQTIVDQGMSMHDLDFRRQMPHTVGCDDIGNHGLRHNRLIRNSVLREADDITKLVQPGDAFLSLKAGNDWTHIGLIVEVHQGFFVTVEGNSNSDGSRNGYELCQRDRNYMTKKNLDVFQLAIE